MLGHKDHKLSVLLLYAHSGLLKDLLYIIFQKVIHLQRHYCFRLLHDIRNLFSMVEKKLPCPQANMLSVLVRYKLIQKEVPISYEYFFKGV